MQRAGDLSRICICGVRSPSRRSVAPRGSRTGPIQPIYSIPPTLANNGALWRRPRRSPVSATPRHADDHELKYTRHLRRELALAILVGDTSTFREHTSVRFKIKNLFKLVARFIYERISRLVEQRGKLISFDGVSLVSRIFGSNDAY